MSTDNGSQQIDQTCRIHNMFETGSILFTSTDVSKLTARRRRGTPQGAAPCGREAAGGGVCGEAERPETGELLLGRKPDSV